MNSSLLRESLDATLQWYHNSNIMLPTDGSWGVGERVLLTDYNLSLHAIHRGFPAYSNYDGYEIIESRRADCNFQAAFLFLLAADILENDSYAKEAENILNYLYCRSGLILKTVPGGGTQICCQYEPGTWNWSHTAWRNLAFFDDNSWACFLQLVIAEHYPLLDQKFECRNWGLRLASLIAEKLPRYLSGEFSEEKLTSAAVWYGDTHSPHWGGLACFALARAERTAHDPRFLFVSKLYFNELMTDPEKYTTSECAYALIAALEWMKTDADELFSRAGLRFAKRLVEAMDENGNIRSEHGEAPAGAHLADTIYTLNWAIIGLQGMARINQEFVRPYEKLLSLLLRIQDKTPEKHLFGCWRGMFDLKTGVWGGGNTFEGGADSIYSGWTNAPIPWCVAFELKKISLFDL